MITALRKMLTGRDNATWDIVRVLGALAVLVALGLTVYSVVWRGQPFDLQSFGLGVCALFSGLGLDRKSTRLNSSHLKLSRMPSSA